jgi:hypothetical protein
MIELAKAILASGLQTAQVRRLYAQALIDMDNFDEAEQVLNQIIHADTVIQAEILEARGLIGRIYKQKYVNNSDPESESNRQNLRRALSEYSYVYQLDPQKHLWHGINVVALLARAQRDKIPVDSPLRVDVLATDILSTLVERDTTSAIELPAYDVATQLEAYVALRRDSDAAGTALRYVDCIDADAFEIHSTSRQLSEVWQLNHSDAPGKHIFPILEAALLNKEGVSLDRSLRNVREEADAVGAAMSDLQALFGEERTVTLAWYKEGLDQCNSIARIEGKDGRGIGTGFLVNASDFFPNRPGLLLLTAEHVVSKRENPHSRPPDQARITFQAMSETFEIENVVWSSPYTELDVSFLSLKGEPKAPALRMHNKAVVMSTPPPRLYIIGHPSGRDIEISLRDNQLIAVNETFLHYRTPSEPGSAGSPVFEAEDWRVVAVHHASSPSMTRFGSKGTYEANEGISILAVQAAIRKLL